MTDKAVNQPQYERVVPGQEEKGKLGNFEGKLTDEEKREVLRHIQSIQASVLKPTGSRHAVPRRRRWFHRHGTVEAKKRKRVRRTMMKKSRMVNARKQKRK